MRRKRITKGNINPPLASRKLLLLFNQIIMALRNFGSTKTNIATALILTIPIMFFFTKPTSSMTLLGKKSTANQVLNYLNQQNQLATYVKAGCTAIVTGGNSGIGIETVKTLAQSGMNVVLCARNIDSAKSVKESLPSPLQERVDIQYLDLANLDSIKKASEEIQSNYKNIDVLVNNAGIMAIKNRETTVNGIELQWGTNHVGHHYFTRLLLPSLNENGRVVTVASTAHTMAGQNIEQDWQSETDYAPWKAYGKSKLSNILFAKSLQNILEKEGKNQYSVSLHPGVIRSPLWKHTLPSLLQPIVSIIADKNLEQGAATNVYCALAKNVEGGAYYDNCAVTQPNANGNDVKLQNQLWEYTEHFLKEKGYEMPSIVTQKEATAMATN